MTKASRRREEFQQMFTEDDILLVEFDHLGRSVLKFSVQYLARIDQEWYPIV